MRPVEFVYNNRIMATDCACLVTVHVTLLNPRRIFTTVDIPLQNIIGQIQRFAFAVVEPRASNMLLPALECTMDTSISLEDRLPSQNALQIPNLPSPLFSPIYRPSMVPPSLSTILSALGGVSTTNDYSDHRRYPLPLPSSALYGSPLAALTPPVWIIYPEKKVTSEESLLFESFPDVEENNNELDMPTEVNWCHSLDSLQAYQWPVSDTEDSNDDAEASAELSETDSIKFTDLDIDWEMFERVSSVSPAMNRPSSDVKVRILLQSWVFLKHCNLAMLSSVVFTQR